MSRQSRAVLIAIFFLPGLAIAFFAIAGNSKLLPLAAGDYSCVERQYANSAGAPFGGNLSSLIGTINNDSQIVGIFKFNIDVTDPEASDTERVDWSNPRQEGWGQFSVVATNPVSEEDSDYVCNRGGFAGWVSESL